MFTNREASDCARIPAENTELGRWQTTQPIVVEYAAGSANRRAGLAVVGGATDCRVDLGISLSEIVLS